VEAGRSTAVEECFLRRRSRKVDRTFSNNVVAAMTIIGISISRKSLLFTAENFVILLQI